MIEFKLEGDKEVIQRLAYAKFFAQRGAADGINGELENLKNFATMNLIPKGVSVTRPGQDINSNWHVISAQPSDTFDIKGTLFNESLHAGYCEVGTGAYALTNYFGENYYKGTNFITPKNSTYLKFMYTGPPKREKSPDPQGKAGTGEYIYARYVKGQEPKRYLGRAVLSEQPKMKMLLGNFIFDNIKNAKGI
jgi:hypothetical protein